MVLAYTKTQRIHQVIIWSFNSSCRRGEGREYDECQLIKIIFYVFFPIFPCKNCHHIIARGRKEKKNTLEGSELVKEVWWKVPKVLLITFPSKGYSKPLHTSFKVIKNCESSFPWKIFSKFFPVLSLLILTCNVQFVNLIFLFS